MSEQVMLTTIDNPFDPFTNLKDWFLFDVEKGYNSCSYLARIAKVSEKMSDSEIDEEVERAIDEIIQYDPFKIYKKIKRSNQKKEINKTENVKES